MNAEDAPAGVADDNMAVVSASISSSIRLLVYIFVETTTKERLK